MKLRFVKSESTFSYFEALESYLLNHGRPVAFYSDKHTVFRVACVFRDDAPGDSDLMRPPVPIFSAHRFRGMRPPIPTTCAH